LADGTRTGFEECDLSSGNGSQTIASHAEEEKTGILCGITVTAMLAATLWPLNPLPRNEVRWLTKANGISFGGAGLVISEEPLRTERLISSRTRWVPPLGLRSRDPAQFAAS